jgi:uncharacterized protein (DUF1810 family)
MPTLNDPFDLQRFEAAQDPQYKSVLEELRTGKKLGHWMWYIFPQLKGLGSSENSIFFGISSRKEAESYLDHPILNHRLKECSRLVVRIADRSIVEIFGATDACKFRSSMSLFARVAQHEQVFNDALQKYFAGEPDQRTLALLKD